MYNVEFSDKFEDLGHQYTVKLYQDIAQHYNVDITDFQVPKDPYSSYDMTATINGEIVYMENKTRSDRYRFNRIKDKGFYLATAKNDGRNTLFNYFWVKDNLALVTNSKQLEDLVPTETEVYHIQACDPDSPPAIVLNYIVPLDHWWIYQITPFKLISKPKTIRK